jgi:hypothetical protein
MSVLYYDKILTENLNAGVGTDTQHAPGGGTRTGTQIGVHSIAVGQLAVEAVWDPGSVAAGGKISTTVTVAGAALQDFVLRSFSLDLQELTFTADVISANTVEVVLANLTGAAVDLASGTLRVVVLRCRV